MKTIKESSDLVKVHSGQTKIMFGKPTSYNYDTLIDQFSGTKINSIRTSSVPLVQFWKDTELRLTKLADKIGLDISKRILCFEYPTPSKGKGKSSMTDLMILGDDFKIAVESKYTEYLRRNKRTELIKTWRVSGENPDNRDKVLNHWTDLIKPFSTDLNNDSINEIEYQFYHRTASACFESKRAFVVYQIFYDSSNKSDLNKFIESIKTYVNLIKPNDKLTFFIWTVDTVLEVDEKSVIDPFIQMKSQDIYRFNSDEIIKL